MIGFIKKLFGAKPAEATQLEAAPYKVEVAPAPTPVAEQATQAVVESIAPAKKPAAKKPAAKTAPAKTAKPKAPRKPKASKPKA
jgi:hypothetical protein